MGKVMFWFVAVFAASSLLLCAAAEGGKRVVVVWSEGTEPKNVYPDGIKGAIAEGLTKDLPDWEVVKGGLNDPDQGVPDDLLKRCDVLIWWGHQKHGLVKDELVAKIVKRVKEEGMGFIALHSSHYAKPNKALMATLVDDPNKAACSWGHYVADTTTTDVKVTDPKHPIAQGIQDFTCANEERYGDPYVVPKPLSVVFEGVSHMKNGQTERSQLGFTWEVGKGRMFYLQLGHESKPIFCDENIRKIMANAVKWAAPEKK
ncbi:MAG: ThuA domain-containing protein [Planctomycetota bacterium]